MLIVVKRLVGMSVGGGIGVEWWYEKSGKGMWISVQEMLCEHRVLLKLK